jgi:hypothetical protein
VNRFPPYLGLRHQGIQGRSCFLFSQKAPKAERDEHIPPSFWTYSRRFVSRTTTISRHRQESRRAYPGKQAIDETGPRQSYAKRAGNALAHAYCSMFP